MKKNEVAKTNTKAAVKNNRSKVHNKTGLVIERNVPIPTPRVTNPFTLVAREMQVNDSVLVDQAPKGIYNLAKKLGVKFAMRKQDGKTRIWRVS